MSYPEFASLTIEDYSNITPIMLLGLDNTFLDTPLAIKESGDLIDCSVNYVVLHMAWQVILVIRRLFCMYLHSS